MPANSFHEGCPVVMRVPAPSDIVIDQVIDHLYRYHERVTSTDKPLRLIESLPDELLRLAVDRYVLPGRRQPLPVFVGIGDSGRSDVSDRVDDLAAAPRPLMVAPKPRPNTPPS